MDKLVAYFGVHGVLDPEQFGDGAEKGLLVVFSAFSLVSGCLAWRPGLERKIERLFDGESRVM